MRWFLVGLAVIGPSFVTPVFAQTKGSDKAAAEALFVEARKLMEAGRYADACPKFESSQRLDPGVGTMLNLAECYEKTGRTASAWAEFREVISAARAADSKEREALARDRAGALESKLSRLTVALSPEASAVMGIEVRRDGVVVDSAELGSSIPADPGKHVIEATAPGKQKWFRTIELGSAGSQMQVLVPGLVDATDNAANTTNSVPPPPPNNVPPPPVEEKKPSRAPAIVAGSIGIVGVGVGTVFGLSASSKWHDAKNACTAYPYGCSSSALSQRSDAKSAATISTVAFAVGAVGLVTGVVLWVSAGSGSTEAKTAVSVGPGSVLVRGSF